MPYSKRIKHLLVTLALTALCVAIAAAMTVRPWAVWKQNTSTEKDLQQQVSELHQQVATLQATKDTLSTKEGIEEAIRNELHYVYPGEILYVYEVEPIGAFPLPAQWPYTVVQKIVDVATTQVTS